MTVGRNANLKSYVRMNCEKNVDSLNFMNLRNYTAKVRADTSGILLSIVLFLFVH